MVDLVESRIAKLREISAHWRRIADGILPTTINGEIEAFACQFDNEVERLKTECLGKRTCPCKLGCFCIAIDTDDSNEEFPYARRAA